LTVLAIGRPGREVYAALLDDSRPPCSVRTMYWILDRHDEVKERRNQPQHSPCANPELIAKGQNQSWPCYIKKLKEGTAKLAYFYLYMILDIFSRYVVGWMVAPRELTVLAKRSIGQSRGKQRIEQDQMIIHSDWGPSMTSKSVALLLADLEITKSLSQSHVNNGNLYSESQFKTLKYRPEFPERFGCIEDTRSFCKNFFHWYNAEHYRSGIGSLTTEDVHYGRAPHIIKERQAVLNAAFLKHPKRFKGRMPKPMVWPFPHLSGSTNRRFPKATRRYTNFYRRCLILIDKFQ
jgi:putative transposase